MKESVIHRQIPERDAAKLRTMLGLPETDNFGNEYRFPDSLKTVYWQARTVSARLSRMDGTDLPDDTLIMVVLAWSQRTGKLVAEDERTFADYVKSGMVEYDADIVVMWRDRIVKAKFRAPSGDYSEMTVQLVGDGTERRVPQGMCLLVSELPPAAKVYESVEEIAAECKVPSAKKDDDKAESKSKAKGKEPVPA